jgi:hypothetical protein
VSISWASRAVAAFTNQPPKRTDKTDESPPSQSACRIPDVGGRVSSVSSVPFETEIEKSHEAGSANQWQLHYLDGRMREITFAPALTERLVRAQYRDAVAAIEIASTLSPENCSHQTQRKSHGV